MMKVKAHAACCPSTLAVAVAFDKVKKLSTARDMLRQSTVIHLAARYGEKRTHT
jgi:hypothetical protein